MNGFVFNNTRKLQIAVAMPAVAASEQKLVDENTDVVSVCAGIAASTVT